MMLTYNKIQPLMEDAEERGLVDTIFTQTIMMHPVSMRGHLYEQDSVIEHFNKSSTAPWDNSPIELSELDIVSINTEHFHTKQLITTFLERNPQLFAVDIDVVYFSQKLCDELVEAIRTHDKTKIEILVRRDPRLLVHQIGEQGTALMYATSIELETILVNERNRFCAILNKVNDLLGEDFFAQEPREYKKKVILPLSPKQGKPVAPVTKTPPCFSEKRGHLCTSSPRPDDTERVRSDDDSVVVPGHGANKTHPLLAMENKPVPTKQKEPCHSASTTHTRSAPRRYQPAIFHMGCEYDYLFKIIISGQNGVGKSSFALRFAEDTYTENHISTIGVDFKIRTITVDDKTIKLQLWDAINPYMRFKSLTYASLRGADAVIHLIDMTDEESLTKTEGDLKEIIPYVGDQPVIILVGSKCDLVSKRVSFEDIGRKAIELKGKGFNVLNEVTTISSKDGIVEAPMTTVARKVMENMRRNDDQKDPLPTKPEPVVMKQKKHQSGCCIQ